MEGFPARFFDGITPRPLEVKLAVVGPMLLIMDANLHELARWPLADLLVPDQDDSLGEAMIQSRGQPEARLIVSDPQTIALLLPHLPRVKTIVAPPRSNLRIWSVVAVLAVAILGGSVLAVWRGPDLLAPLVPQSWEVGLGDFVLDQMAGSLEVCIAPEGIAALDSLTGRLMAGARYDGPRRVTVVKSKIVNAFALPGGRMVIFDELLQEAVSPDEVAGVFAHELGHVVNRHPMRGMLRQYGISFLRRMALGGYSDAVESAAGFGETMLALRNGRDAEREADASALAYLSAAGMRQDGLYTFFTRLAEKGDAADDFGILASHPPLKERMQATLRPGEGKAALDYGQWQALRKICSEVTKPKARPSGKDKHL